MHRSVAEAESAGLRHAVHGGLARSQAPGRAGAPEIPVNVVATRVAFHGRPVRHRTRLGRAFDPGIQCADPPHAAWQCAAYRRLEDRSDAGHRPADRRSQAAQARRGGRARRRRQFHQRRARGPLAVGNRCREDLARADRSGAGTRRGHHLRLQRGAHARGGGSRARRRPRSRGGRPRHGARGRRSRARPAISTACRSFAAPTPTAICRPTRWWRSAPAARASRARRFRASRRTIIPT